MHSKWYISVLVVMLTVLGSITSKQQMSSPNQEIVLQFTSGEVTYHDTETTISTVKQQLQKAGVENIQVSETEEGQLKITYYSDFDVESIKAILSKEKQLELGYALDENENQSEFPSEEKSINYDFDVYEIQNTSHNSSQLGGKLALELKADNDRIFNPNVFISLDQISLEEVNKIEKVAYKFRKNIAIAIDNISHKIPEVRAGPSTIEICALS